MNYKLGMFIVVSCFSLLLACKKKTTTPTTTPTENVPTGQLKFHLHTFIGENEVDAYGIEMTMPDGRMISLDMAQLYISDIQLVKLDGSYYNVPSNGVLKVFESESVTIGNVPVGNYKTVRFKVGLSPTVNALEPTTSGYANLLNQPEMWFSSSVQPDGYTFLNFSGSIDTTLTKTGDKVPFEYKIGTNANLTQIEMPAQNFTIYKDVVGYVHMKIEYDRLFEGVQLSNHANLHVKTKADNALPIVETLKKNIQKLFIYEN
jgi:hypothetical protein